MSGLNTLPMSLQIEAGIIGSATTHPDFLLQIEWLKPKFFQDSLNSAVFWAMNQLIYNGIENIDDLNIGKIINEQYNLQYVIDNSNVCQKLSIRSLQEYLQLCSKVARNTIEEYKFLASDIVNNAFKMEAQNVLGSLENTCMDSKYNLNELNTIFHQELDRLAENFILEKDIKLYGEEMDETWAKIKAMRNNGVIGIPSKYDMVSKFFTYRPKELYIIGGRPKAGKSTFFLNEIHHQLQSGLSVAVFDTEMDKELHLPRALGIDSGLKIKEIETGKFEEDPEKITIFENSYGWWKKQKFVHIYDPQWTYEKIYTTAKKLVLNPEFQLDLLFFDYLKDTGSGDFNSDKLNYGLGEFTDFLKNKIAGDLDIPVITGAQMSPYATKLADSDSFNRYATVVAYWMEKEGEEYIADINKGAGNYKIIIDYNRIGERTVKYSKQKGINFIFDQSTGRIVEAPHQPLRDLLEQEY